MRWFLRLLAAVFLLAGVFLLRGGLGLFGPGQPPVVLQAAVESVAFGDTKKLGHTVSLELEGLDERFLRANIQKVEGLEARLRERLVVGQLVEVRTVKRPTAGAYASRSIPLAIVQLRIGDDLLVADEMWQDSMAVIVQLAPVLAGGLAVLVAITLLVLSFRRAAPAS
ncbi:MAG: hypothetical protein AB8H80_04820 [Planctomycetota bacterium]